MTTAPRVASHEPGRPGLADFTVGFHQIHPDTSVNLQLNRFSDGSTAQLLGQELQDPVEGDPGRMPRLVHEGDRENRVRRRRDTGRVARR